MSVLVPRGRVRIQGIAARPELNGRTGDAVRFVRSKGRWEVQLEGGDPGVAPIGLRPGNLEPLWDHHSVECAICLGSLSTGETECLPCSHSFHADCIQEMKDCGAVNVCACCRRVHADLRTVQWLVDEAATLIIQANRAPPESKRVRKLAAYTCDLLQEARETEPPDAVGYHNLGTVLEQIGCLDGAISVYRAAVKRHPDDASFWISLGAILGEKGEIHDASEAYRKAVEINPSDAKSNGSLGVMLNMKGKKEAAISAFRAACQADPSDASFHGSLGEMLAGHGDFDGAITAFTLAVNADPSDAEMHCRLADVMRTNDDKDGAIASFQAAVSIDPSVGSAQKQLQELLTSRREDEERKASTGVAAGGNAGGYADGLDGRRCEIERRRPEVESQRRDVELSMSAESP